MMHVTGNRIIILGCPGSGKSTLASVLHEITGLPLYHLDNIWWRADKTHITREKFDLILSDILKQERWIIDGDYSRTYEPRFAACDTVIFLDLSEEECMAGISERTGKVREDMPWTEDKPGPDLVEQVHNYRKSNRPKLYGMIRQHPDKEVLVFSQRAQVQKWLSEIRAERSRRS